MLHLDGIFIQIVPVTLLVLIGTRRNDFYTGGWCTLEDEWIVSVFGQNRYVCLCLFCRCPNIKISTRVCLPACIYWKNNCRIKSMDTATGNQTMSFQLYGPLAKLIKRSLRIINLTIVIIIHRTFDVHFGVFNLRYVTREGRIQDNFWGRGWGGVRFDQITILCVFGQSSLSKQCRPRSDATEGGVW